MDQTTLAIIGIGGLILFVMLVSGVLKSVLSRGIDNLFAFGIKKIGKKRNDEIDQMVAVPLVMTSPASASQIMSTLDTIVGAKKAAPPLGGAVYEVSRTASKITYALGNKLYPQNFVAEVGFGERDGQTQIVFKCLHLTEKDGVRAGADALAILRDSVEYAVGATGDPERIAHGLKLYGPPEPGSARAIRMRNAKTVLWIGVALFVVAMFKLGTGVKVSESPLYFGMLLAGAGCAYLAQRMDRLTAAQREAELAGSPVDTVQVLLGEGAQAARLEGALEATHAAAKTAAEAGTTAATALAKGAGRASAAYTALSPKSRLLVIGAALAVLVVVGFVISNGQSSGPGSGAPDSVSEADYNPGGTGGGYTPSADVTPVDDAPTADDLTPNGHAHWVQLPDIIAGAPEDGSSRHALVTYTAEGGDSDSFILEADDISLGGSDPAYIHDIQLFSDELGQCYFDDQPVSVDEFMDLISYGSATPGSIDFTQDAITRSNAYSEDYVPPNGY